MPFAFSRIIRYIFNFIFNFRAKAMHLLSILLLLLVLVGCGQKGPLFLPEAQQEDALKLTQETLIQEASSQVADRTTENPVFAK